MKNNRIILLLLVMAMGVNQTYAQRHLYQRIELGGGNVYSFLGATLVSGLVNTLVKKPILESTLRFGIPSSEYGNLQTYQGFVDAHASSFSSDEEYKDDLDQMVKGNGRNIFSNILIGDKVGYLSDRMGAINYCVYGAAYYNLLQLRAMADETHYVPVRTNRLQLGGGAMLIIGSIEKQNRFILDGGVRYNIPLAYSMDGCNLSTTDFLGNGISSHYMVKWSYASTVAVGATVDIMHYDLFKTNDICGSHSRMYEFGINVAILINR